MKKLFFNKSKKEKKTQPENIDSNEIARQIAIETVKDTERIFHKISSFFGSIWKFLTTPNMILSVIQIKNLDHIYESFLRNEKLNKILALVVAIN